MSEDLFDPVAVPFLGGHPCQFLYEEHPDDPDVRAAMARLLDPTSRLREVLETYLVEYCRHVLANYPSEWPRPEVGLEQPGDIWSYVSMGNALGETSITVSREKDGIYFSMEGNCEWEAEHGLHIVIRDGHVVVKVGPCDGHLTNDDAD